jgi:hypothetical protein
MIAPTLFVRSLPPQGAPPALARPGGRPRL